MLLGCLVVVLVDDCRPDPPKQSMTHLIFMLVVLYPSTYNIADFDVLILNWISNRLTGVQLPWGGEAIVLKSTLTLCVHLLLVLVLNILAARTLTHIAARNTRVYLLFPFQFFTLMVAVGLELTQPRGLMCACLSPA